MKKIILTFFFVCLYAKDVVSFSYEEWKFNNETLGVTKLSYDNYINKNFYSGMSFFGAAKGKRGGFFTFGYNIGYLKTIYERFAINPEFFIGAGGGGAAPQGGGLMIRPSIALIYTTKKYDFGVGYSHVNFINGDIKSSQFFITTNIKDFFRKIENKKILLSFPISVYKPKSDILTTENKIQKNFYLVGIDIKSIDKYYFYSVALNGAFKGESNGYMDIFLGGGFNYEIFDDLIAFLYFGLGEGGGGRVKTTNGLLFKTSISVDYKISNLHAGFKYGYIANNSFKAKTNSFYLAIDEKINKSFLKSIAIRPIMKLHINTNKGKQYLEGISFDYYITKSIFISGKSLWAFAPNSGGYTEGLLGIGRKINIYKKLNLLAEVFAGAAGGGGIDVGGGYLYGYNLNIGYKINKFMPYIGVGESYFTNRKSKDYLLGIKLTF